jgi:bifunctional non-homologous end joining protein LigD
VDRDYPGAAMNVLAISRSSDRPAAASADPGGVVLYRKKRDFSKTPEPKGESSANPEPKTQRRFVVQKHAARRLHYDFRLELCSVLKSWAVPRGPSLDPGIKRLAIEVEDHPLEYADFEGVIREGQYGAGVVLIWDRGTWIPQSDPVKSYQRGTLEFELRGERLRGGWVLVRLNRRTRQRYWLLIKKRDAEARPGSGDAIMAQYQTSIITGRDPKAVAAAHDRGVR